MTLPTWLDPAKEIKPDQFQPEWFKALPNTKGGKDITFILMCLQSLKDLNYPGLTLERMFQVIANMNSETGWGKTWRGFNFGGWKINEKYVVAYKATHQGESPHWTQAEGHVASGDEQVVYYRCFDDPGKFLREWLERFVPKQSDIKHRYHKTGIVFWSDNLDGWFKELCLAGYKGPVTEANPEPSVIAFHSIVSRTKFLFLQHVIGNLPDGTWDNKTDELVLENYKKKHQLSTTEQVIEHGFNNMMFVIP